MRRSVLAVALLCSSEALTKTCLCLRFLQILLLFSCLSGHLPPPLTDRSICSSLRCRLRCVMILVWGTFPFALSTHFLHVYPPPSYPVSVFGVPSHQPLFRPPFGPRPSCLPLSTLSSRPHPCAPFPCKPPRYFAFLPPVSLSFLPELP